MTNMTPAERLLYWIDRCKTRDEIDALAKDHRDTMRHLAAHDPNAEFEIKLAAERKRRELTEKDK